MPIDARIPMSIQYPQNDMVGNMQKGFNFAQQVKQAPIKQKAMMRQDKAADMEFELNKINAIGGLLRGAVDQDSYTQKRNIAINAGLVSADEVPEAYDPNVVAGWQGTLNTAKEALDRRYKESQINMNQKGGASGVFVDRLKNEPNFAAAYFGKANAAKGVVENPNTGYVEPKKGFAAAQAANETVIAKEEGRREAESELPRYEDNANETLQLIDDIYNHEGLSAVVGVPEPLSGSLGVVSLPGTAAKDFEVLLGELEGKNFLQAFEGLKGGGHITEKEGQEAKKAIAALQTAQSEFQFKKQLNKLRGIIEKGLAHKRAKARGGNNKPAVQSGSMVDLKDPRVMQAIKLGYSPDEVMQFLGGAK